jgi:hypothetical protein
MALFSAYHTTSFYRNLLGNARYSPQSLKPLLDFEELDGRQLKEATSRPKDEDEDFYQHRDYQQSLQSREAWRKTRIGIEGNQFPYY